MKLVDYIARVFSDSGEPSSSRILTFILGISSAVILFTLFHHLFELKDNAALALWLASLPVIIAALTGLTAAPYAINRGTCNLSDFISAFRRQP